MKFLASLTLSAIVSTLSVPAMAQFQKPEDAIKYRKSVMTIQATHLGLSLIHISEPTRPY